MTRTVVEAYEVPKVLIRSLLLYAVEVAVAYPHQVLVLQHEGVFVGVESPDDVSVALDV